MSFAQKFSYSKTSEIRLLLASKDLESGRFADTILSDQPEDFTRAGDRQPMEFEGILGVTMRSVLLKVRWDVDDCDRVEWTFL